MELTLLGTGCPNVDPNRMGPSQLIRHDGHALLIDCGSGVTQRMVSAGFNCREIDAVLLTHLHSDHLVDLYQLISTSWQRGRDRPQRIYGPAGTRRFVEGTMELWKHELEGRIAHEARGSTAALDTEIVEFTEGEVLRLGDLTVEAVEVNHQPVNNAFGFICKTPEETIVLSGDTTYCPPLIQAARGADLLVHEVFIHREFKEIPGVRTRETIANVGSYHTASDVVGKVAAEAGVKGLVLSHFAPTHFDKQALLDEVRRDYGGFLAIGEDLMKIDVTAGTVSHAGALWKLPDRRG